MKTWKEDRPQRQKSRRPFTQRGKRQRHHTQSAFHKHWEPVSLPLLVDRHPHSNSLFWNEPVVTGRELPHSVGVCAPWVHLHVALTCILSHLHTGHILMPGADVVGMWLQGKLIVALSSPVCCSRSQIDMGGCGQKRDIFVATCGYCRSPKSLRASSLNVCLVLLAQSLICLISLKTWQWGTTCSQVVTTHAT